MIKKITLFISIILFILFTGCDKSGEDDANQESTPNVNNNNDNDDKQVDKNKNGDYNDFTENMKKLEEMMKGGEDVEVIDHRKLKDFLPSELKGMKRISSTGEKTNSFGINVSQTESTYSSEKENQKITISITDLGSMKGLAGLAAFGWTYAELDKETETGYEKTTMFSGYKAFEKYDTKYNDGSIEVLVGDRFMVKVEGFDVPMEWIHSAMGEIGLDDLESMKNEGIKEK